MKLSIKQLKIAAVAAMSAFTFAALVLFQPVTLAASPQDDAAVFFKAKCAMCHGQKAEKMFDATKADAELVEAVLKGKKPKMPSFEKSVNEDQSKALVAFMKELKK